ncbi:Soluble P-type ATPase [Syntrophus gentianae]|uniref:Soluble P-type ATPase n=1 Tax=Syntrophus gentianae TaxID=43775 RepID=A0A1H8A4I7_9BACT|nr:HAD family hydrolase [Syntrophus gentianae]SEM64824.1 Soluble P-type ATPase [Syntrophus gentianae]
MISISVPGYGALQLKYLVMDYNGTLAVDGRLLEGVSARLQQLSGQLELHVVTADTFGCVQNALDHMPCTVHVLPLGDQARAKENYIRNLGAEWTVAMGNGRNDRLMLAVAALGIGVILAEGACGATLAAADVVCRSIEDALDLLLFPQRLIATLRS